MTFNTQNWSVSEAIKQRAELESIAEWAKSSEQGFTPRYEPHSASHKPSVGIANFYRGIIKFSLEFRP